MTVPALKELSAILYPGAKFGEFISIYQNANSCRYVEKKGKKQFDYSIDNNILQRVTEFNYHGIAITPNLSCCEDM